MRVDCIVRKSFGCQEKESESDFARNCSALKKNSDRRRQCIARKCFVCQVKQHTTEFSRDIKVPSKVINLCSAKISS